MTACARRPRRWSPAGRPQPARTAPGRGAQVARGTTVGFKRLLRFETVRANGVQVVITEARGTPALSEVSLFTASVGEGALPESPNR